MLIMSIVDGDGGAVNAARLRRSRPTDRREDEQLGDVPRIHGVAVGHASAARVAGCRAGHAKSRSLKTPRLV